MSDWNQQFTAWLDEVTAQAETVFVDLSTTIDQNLETIAQVAEQAGQQMAETLDKEVSPWVEQLLQPLLDAPLEIDVEIDAAIEAVVQPWRQTIEPPLNHHPVCSGCKHYHGESYGGNLLVCGMYPFGLTADQVTCPDKENVDWQEPWKTWLGAVNQRMRQHLKRQPFLWRLLN